MMTWKRTARWAKICAASTLFQAWDPFFLRALAIQNPQEVREVSGPQRTVHGRKATAFIPKKAATPNVLTSGPKPWQVQPFPSTPWHDFYNIFTVC